MSVPYLLTGVTGGLGAKILQDMLEKHNVLPRNIIATSRDEGKRAHFEALGVGFRVANYQHLDTLETAFRGIDNLLFMSSSERDTSKRNVEHQNVVWAAKKTGVKKVWYVSLALGGFEDGSKVGFQQAHYHTEELLVKSGLDFVSLRAGIYTDAFPLALNWYPSTKTVVLPRIDHIEDGKVAWTSRKELGEGIATLLAKGLSAFPSIQPGTEKHIILLTGPQAETLFDLISAIDRSRGSKTSIQMLDTQEWIAACSKDDEGGKGAAWFEARLIWLQGMCMGEAETVDKALETLLGRRPEKGTETLQKLLKQDPEYYWHQNHVVWPRR